MSSSNTAPVSAANDDTAAFVETSAAPLDQDQLCVEELAARVLAREFRPRVGSIMRLAEAVLARREAAMTAEAVGKAKKKKKKAGGKKRKLAWIPGQKEKKKA